MEAQHQTINILLLMHKHSPQRLHTPVKRVNFWSTLSQIRQIPLLWAWSVSPSNRHTPANTWHTLHSHNQISSHFHWHTVHPIKIPPKTIAHSRQDT